MIPSSGMAICRKNRGFEHDNNKGIVDILFVEVGNKYQKHCPDHPSEDGIFITQGYKEAVEHFQDDEIFRVEYKESEYDNWQEGHSKKRYVAKGSHIKSVTNKEMIPIIKAKLPDIKDCILHYHAEPPKKPFFIEDNGKVYGLFSCKKINNHLEIHMQYKLEPVSKLNQLINVTHDHHIAEFDSSSINDIKLGNERIGFYIPNISDLGFLREIKTTDFVSDEELISYFAKNGIGKSKKLLSKEKVRILQEEIGTQLKQNKILRNRERVKRFENLLDMYLKHDNVGKEIIDDWLATEAGENFLGTYLKTDGREILEKGDNEIKKEIESKKAAKEKAIEKINEEITKRKEEYKKEIEELRKKAKNDKQEIDKALEEHKQKAEFEKKKALEGELKELQQNVNNETENLDKLKKETCQLETVKIHGIDIQALESEKKSLENKIEYYQELIDKKCSKVIEVAREQDILTQLRSIDFQTKEDSNQSIYVNESTKTINSANDYLDDIETYFENVDGRTLSRDEIANLLICISQNYMTCLAGMPGSGKTSSVFNLAEAMGLYNKSLEANQINSFLSISVGQGWSSTRDLLGYYNAIKGCFQPAPTKLYELLKAMEKEKQDYLSLVLLDEGNLSPMEHYWSDFLLASDKKYRDKKIYLSSSKNEFLAPGDNLRWITTVNSDETTERLSPRLLDRMPVIKMDASIDLKDFFDETHNATEPLGTVEWSQLQTWFNPTKTKDFFNSDKEVIQAIIEISKENKIMSISPRKISSIQRYLATANEYIKTPNLALDYSISMYILPSINGFGSNFYSNLKKLEHCLDKYELENSSSIVRSILEKGQASQTYSYF